MGHRFAAFGFRCCLFVVLAAVLVNGQTMSADIYRWDNLAVIPGTEGIEPGPGVRLDHRELAYAGLGNLDLTDSSFNLSNLSSAVMANSTLTNADLSGANLTNANLYSATLTNADLTQANLTNAYLYNTSLRNADLTGAVVTGTVFFNATSSGFTSAQLYSTQSYQAKNLSGIGLAYNDLSGWNFAEQNFTNANLYFANLTNADLTGAMVTGANLYYTGLTSAPLYSTQSYQAKNLSGISLGGGSLSGWNFAEQNLTNANLGGAILRNADLTGAVVTGTSFGGTTSSGFTSAQLYSTQSYQAKNLSGIGLAYNDLSRWNFAEQNLTNANLYSANLTNADLTHANLTNASLGGAILWNADLSFTDTRGAQGLYLTGAISRNAILPGGTIASLDLAAGDKLVVRNYHEDPNQGLGGIPIAIQVHMALAGGSVLQLLFDANDWNSSISFQPGIPVELGGTLEFTFAEDVDFATQIGRTIRIFDWTGVSPTGAFTVSSLYPWDTSKLYTTGEVTLLLPGDTNADGAVNINDLNNVRNNFGLTGEGISGDTNADRVIDLVDLTNVRNFFGFKPNAEPVPEPSSLLLLVGAVSALIALRAACNHKAASKS